MDPILLTVIGLVILGVVLVAAGLVAAVAYWWLSRQAAAQSAIQSFGRRPWKLILSRVGIGVCLAIIGAVGCSTKPQTTQVEFKTVGSQLTGS
jgi:hypothetical protein